MIEIYLFLLVSGISFALGTILHELGHVLFCHLTGVEVIGVSYFNLDEDVEADGFVIHEPPQTFLQSLLITIGPFFTVGGVLVLIVIFLINNPQWLFTDSFLIMAIVMGFGISMFPSTHDVNNLIEFITTNYKFSIRNLHIWLFFPFVYLLKICSYFYVKLIIFIAGFIVLVSMFSV
ncbi:MAG: hypothetical protein DRP10_04110 [Candidatus Aenigmatarchaeota archaeon]|nr:MAG: hypothetical protein DRP10_04110 [Candidatus Aenigmarchaeota archaeon]